ncbi:hypothetical protein [Psittacicella hinzii]|uniref:Uncharacterized protein n=1 Tax=Psittacicella hinzii TaxID=2028575 RepID=A0A3A1YQ51_9GAMM|nr:hypothetical protein [Psittacicella hinzii]RIY40322.1 hypothetical protein CKF58_00725 [Psittacicella hinzii]
MAKQHNLKHKLAVNVWHSAKTLQAPIAHLQLQENLVVVDYAQIYQFYPLVPWQREVREVQDSLNDIKSDIDTTTNISSKGCISILFFASAHAVESLLAQTQQDHDQLELTTTDLSVLLTQMQTTAGQQVVCLAPGDSTRQAIVSALQELATTYPQVASWQVFTSEQTQGKLGFAENLELFLTSLTKAKVKTQFEINLYYFTSKQSTLSALEPQVIERILQTAAENTGHSFSCKKIEVLRCYQMLIDLQQICTLLLAESSTKTNPHSTNEVEDWELWLDEVCAQKSAQQSEDELESLDISSGANEDSRTNEQASVAFAEGEIADDFIHPEESNFFKPAKDSASYIFNTLTDYQYAAYGLSYEVKKLDLDTLESAEQVCQLHEVSVDSKNSTYSSNGNKSSSFFSTVTSTLRDFKLAHVARSPKSLTWHESLHLPDFTVLCQIINDLEHLSPAYTPHLLRQLGLELKLDFKADIKQQVTNFSTYLLYYLVAINCQQLAVNPVKGICAQHLAKLYQQLCLRLAQWQVQICGDLTIAKQILQCQQELATTMQVGDKLQVFILPTSERAKEYLACYTQNPKKQNPQTEAAELGVWFALVENTEVETYEYLCQQVLQLQSSWQELSTKDYTSRIKQLTNTLLQIW